MEGIAESVLLCERWLCAECGSWAGSSEPLDLLSWAWGGIIKTLFSKDVRVWTAEFGEIVTCIAPLLLSSAYGAVAHRISSQSPESHSRSPAYLTSHSLSPPSHQVLHVLPPQDLFGFYPPFTILFQSLIIFHLGTWDTFLTDLPGTLSCQPQIHP